MQFHRRRPWVDLDAASALPYLEHGLGPCRIVSLEALSGGFCNTNYRVSLEERDEPVVLRLFTNDRGACGREVAVSQALAGQVPVPEVLFARPEATPYPYLVRRFAPGATGRLGSNGRSMGTILAAMQRTRFADFGFLGAQLTVQPWAAGAAGYAQYVRDCLAERAGARLTPQTRRAVEDLLHCAQWNATPVLSHGDFNAKNLLFDGDLVVGVLDWEFAHAGHPLSDVGNLFRYDPPADFEASFVTAYREGGGVLNDGWRHTARLLDLANLCEFLNAPTDNPELFEEVTGLIEKTLARAQEPERRQA